MKTRLRALCTLLLALTLALPMAVSPHRAQAAAPGSMTAQQRSSLAMLNYLTVLSQEITASDNSRLRLEEIYSLLLNNTQPSAVDPETLSLLRSMLDTLEDFRVRAFKRERLEMELAQEKAAKVSQTAADCFGLAYRLTSENTAQALVALASLGASVYGLTQSASTADDPDNPELLAQDLALTEAENAAIHAARRDAFTYMISIVQSQGLPGELALSENAVADYVQWKNEPSLSRRIRFLESNEATYSGFGPYWLLLAESYYQQGSYARCLVAIDHYEQLDVHIFRKDYEYARALTTAIASARQVMAADVFESTVPSYITAILDNCDGDDWELRYFVATTYLDLYSKTHKAEYLRKAYDVVLNCVNYLAATQTAMNNAWLNEVETVPVDRNADKALKTEIQRYNELLKEERSAALPPLYQPLILHCDLLLTLADMMNLSAVQRQRIDDILHPDGASLFLAERLDALYWFSGQKTSQALADVMTVTMGDNWFSLPAMQVVEGAKVIVEVRRGSSVTVFDDYAPNQVSRNSYTPLERCSANFYSAAANAFSFKEGDEIYVTVHPLANSRARPLTFEFVTVTEKVFAVIPRIVFKRVN